VDENDFKSIVDAGVAETKSHCDKAAANMGRHFDETAERLSVEMRRHMDVAAEATRHEIRLLDEKIDQFGEHLRRETAGIRDEMRRGFADTQAMLITGR
jgi:hypothetical protein